VTTGFPNTVFFDVDTQIDFLYPAGALYVPGAEHIVGALARLNRHAAEHGNLVISTMDAHAEDDAEFRQWPPHCVVGTAGQHKPAATLLEKRVVIPNARCATNLAGVRQILLEKQALDCFTNVNLSPTLRSLGAGRYVVYGVVTEICVKFAAFGLLKMGGLLESGGRLKTGVRVELVTDALRGLDGSAAADALRAFTAQGGVLTTLDAVTAR
jgi:nicotinamidase/pyrazinamidase